MKIIACLGWGSLIWYPDGLPVQREWFKDGPLAPVEFKRKSRDDRITLVIDSTAVPVRLLWALMRTSDLEVARMALKKREGSELSSIGSWQKGETVPIDIPGLPLWAEARGLDAVIWSALGPKFDRQNPSPSIEKVIEHLQSLTGTARDNAERYIRRAPRQIDTEYRRRIEAVFGWTYQEY